MKKKGMLPKSGTMPYHPQGHGCPRA